MSVFTNQILQQVYEKLTANSSLMSLVNDAVFDHVPQEEVFPFVAIGELIETENNTDDPQQGVQASLNVHSFSRDYGRNVTGQIQLEITNALHRATLTSSGSNFLSIDEVQAQSFIDADGITNHGIIEFNIIVTEV